MILSMTLEHCFTKTLAIYVSCARLVFHPFPNWLLVLSEHRPIQAPDAGSVAAPLWWRLRIRLRDRHCCHNRQHLSRSQRTPLRGLLLVLYTTWCGSFESVVICMGGARKYNTFTQLVLLASWWPLLAGIGRWASDPLCEPQRGGVFVGSRSISYHHITSYQHFGFFSMFWRRQWFVSVILCVILFSSFWQHIIGIIFESKIQAATCMNHNCNFVS